MDLVLRNGEYKEQSGNQGFNGLQATVMNYVSIEYIFVFTFSDSC